MSTVFTERELSLSGSKTASFRADDVAASQEFRRNYETLPNVISAEDMPFEKSADGLIKHLVHKQMQTRECCVEAYMQFLKAGSGPASTGICGKRSSSWLKEAGTTCIGT